MLLSSISPKYSRCDRTRDWTTSIRTEDGTWTEHFLWTLPPWKQRDQSDQTKRVNDLIYRPVIWFEWPESHLLYCTVILYYSVGACHTNNVSPSQSPALTHTLTRTHFTCALSLLCIKLALNSIGDFLYDWDPDGSRVCWPLHWGLHYIWALISFLSLVWWSLFC